MCRTATRGGWSRLTTLCRGMRAAWLIAIAAVVLAAAPSALAQVPTGACCNADATCTPGVTQADCEANGGTYLGNGTTCGDPCPPWGACCLPDGSCVRRNAAGCAFDGGQYQGDNSVQDPCTDPVPVVCPQPGACCFADGTCESIAEFACMGRGGIFLGVGAACVSNPCKGACCLPNGTCEEKIRTTTMNPNELCMADGGNYQGDGRECASTVCGACCLPDGLCNAGSTPTKCMAAGGIFLDGAPCITNPCKGACCLPNGTCEEKIRTITMNPNELCMADGGNYQGDGSLCADVVCGACCLPDGLCNAGSTPTKCMAAGGIFLADAPCVSNPCKGACCLPEGTCEELIRVVGMNPNDLCDARGGSYQGDGRECVNTVCGACCLPDGNCQISSEELCAPMKGGLFIGQGTTCEINFCTGACCFKDGTCMEVIRTAVDSAEDVCLGLGGKYQGDGSDCDPNRCQRSHTGWNWVDNLITLTKNEPCYWSAYSGQPKGVSPFTVLDPPGPGALHGRPAPDGTDERVLRGYIIAYAVNGNGEEVRWNHLKGDVTIVNYADDSAWEYNAYAFPVVAGVANGAATGTTGILNLDGAEYVPGYDLLLMDFYASGANIFNTPDAGVTVDTDLTLLPISVDLRQETDGPITTKAHFDVWNMNEVKFSGAYRCITCWDQWLLSQHEIPNHFLRASLQTDKGKARIDGLASHLCDVDNDPKDQKAIGEDINDVVSVEASLLGVVMKELAFGPPINLAGFPDNGKVARAGTMLHGMGTQPGVIKVDVLGPPDEAQSPEDVVLDPVNELLRAAGLSDIAPVSPRQSANAQGGAAGAGTNRVSGSEKGSLLIFPKIELRWDENGDLIQDTFVDISNDYPEDIWVQMYFINGDPPLDAKRSHKDDVERELPE